MAKFSVSISYEQLDGTYSEFLDITNDVIASSITNIKEELEPSNYDVGVVTFGRITVKLKNNHGLYSESGKVDSIFPVKRDQSIIKVSWTRNYYDIYCGEAVCGETYLSDEVQIFKGLVEDNSTTFDAFNQEITLKVLSLESIIRKVQTPFGSLSSSDNLSVTAYNILNQSAITKFFTVDQSNISMSIDYQPDTVAPLENISCLDALKLVLQAGNAIMFTRDDTIYIRSRDADASSSYTFYSPSAVSGIENIINVSEYSTGLNRTFNSWTWEDTNINRSVADSIAIYGERIKQLNNELVTNTTKRQNLLDNYLTEFQNPVIELDLTAPLYTEIAELGFLNKVNIDYPSELIVEVNDIVSRYSQSKYGTARYARTLSSIFIESTREWKILNRKINLNNHTITFKLKEVV